MTLQDAPDAYEIRDAGDQDMAAVAAIYAHYVLHSTATFETVPPGATDMRERWNMLQEDGLPYLVAVSAAGEIAGYAYAGPFKRRAAYAHTIEDSLYLHPEHTGRGLGKRLLQVLIERCEALGHRQMVAVIGGADNHASVGVHTACGFESAGQFHAAGWKFDHWVDILFMQRALGPGSSTAPRA